jgi:adenosylcobinamide-GDP ribazoletransferase
MKSFVFGFILNIQFFSTIPLPSEVPVDKKHLKRALQTFPLLGIMQGVIYAGFLYILLEWTSLSALAVAFLVWLLIILLTGGLHLDGWLDCSDAYFSYRDQAARLRIMEDPRVGAFGILSVIVLLAARFLFIYEIILMSGIAVYFFIISIPFLGSMLMGMMLTLAPLAKEEGMAFFFRKAIRPKSIWTYPVYIILFLVGTGLFVPAFLYYLIIMLLAITILFLLFRRKSVKWFGGITGDVIGASREGAEIILWMIVWLLLYFGMG